MSLSRANLRGSPAKVTWNGATFHSRDDINTPLAPDYDDVITSMYGAVDKTAKDFRAEISLRLWGAWENLSVLFPSGVINPVVGTRIYGSSDLPLVIHGRNQDRITFHNAQITKLADLYLGIDAEIFSADVTFTALIKNNANPEDAASYFTADTAAYADNFAKTNYKRQRYAGAWGSIAGFTAFQAHKGVNIAWDMQLSPEYNANVGTVDMILTGFRGACRCLPIEPTMAEIIAANNLQGTSNPLGRLASAGATAAADLVWTGSGVSVTLKNAALLASGFAWGVEPLRNGECVWETTRGFSAGSPVAVAVLA